MTPEERNVIGGIFDRLREAASQPRDPEAERFIADRVREQPYAPYAMAQTIYVQEQALNNLGRQVEELQAEVARLRQGAAQQQQPSGGFLSSIFGGGSRPSAAPSFGQPRPAGGPGFGQSGPRAGGPSGGPWGRPGGDYGQQPMQAPPQRGGMGFLGAAAATAAGVAGGMIAGNALMNAFNNHGGVDGVANSLGLGGDKGSEATAQSDNGSGAYDAAGYEDPGQGQGDASYDNASYEDEGGGFDGGDSGDWA